MWLAHYAPAFLVKPFLPNTSLGALMLATQLPDAISFLSCILSPLTGEVWRYNKNKPGSMPFDYLTPYTHSLEGMLIMGVVYCFLYLVVMRHDLTNHQSVNTGDSVFVKLGCFMLLFVSHWILELPVHRLEDDWMPARLGTRGPFHIQLEAWNSMLLTNALEFGILLPSIAVYSAMTEYITQPKAWYQRLDVLTAVCVVCNLLMCAPPRFVYESVPDRLLLAQAIGQIFFQSWLGHQVDSIRRCKGQHTARKQL